MGMALMVILVDAVEGGGRARAPRRDHGRAHLHRLVERAGGAVKQPVQEREQLPVGARIIHRAADDDAVGLGELGRGLVDEIVEDAPAALAARIAAYTTPHVPMAHIDPFHCNALRRQRGFHLAQRAVRAAVEMRAAVDDQYFHSRDGFKYCGCKNNILVRCRQVPKNYSV